MAWRTDLTRSDRFCRRPTLCAASRACLLTLNKLSYFNGVAESLDEVAGHIDDLGGPKSHGAYPAAWAYATATPFTYDEALVRGHVTPDELNNVSG